MSDVHAPRAASFATSGTGRRLYVDPHDERAQELLRSGASMNAGSRQLWGAVLALRDWDVVVDVGANYGEMTLGVPVPASARIVCFEPNPRVVPHLRRSVGESGIDVDLREVAVGAREGEADFVVDTVWSGRSGLADVRRTDADHHVETVTVPVVPLDAELRLTDADSVCVKVDVEGGELDVLEGARRLVTSSRPWAVMVEVLHLDLFEKAELASAYTMRVMDRRTGDLLVVPPASPQRVSELLGSGWVHGQDAVLTARDAA